MQKAGSFACVIWPGSLAWISGRSQDLISHHMRTLRFLGLVRSRRDGKLVMYRLTERGEILFGTVIGGEGGA